MNSVYQQLRSNFEADTAYQGADVLAAILGVIKVVYNYYSTILSQHLNSLYFLFAAIDLISQRDSNAYIEIIFVIDMQFCETNIFFFIVSKLPLCKCLCVGISVFPILSLILIRKHVS